MMAGQDGAFITTTESQVHGRHMKLRCRLGWHPWPTQWPKPRITPDIMNGPDGQVLLGYHWTCHRRCPDCGSIQTKVIPLKR